MICAFVHDLQATTGWTSWVPTRCWRCAGEPGCSLNRKPFIELFRTVVSSAQQSPLPSFPLQIHALDAVSPGTPPQGERLGALHC